MDIKQVQLEGQEVQEQLYQESQEPQFNDIQENVIQSFDQNSNQVDQRYLLDLEIKRLKQIIVDLESKISFDKNARLAGIEDKYLDLLWHYLKGNNQDMSLLKDQFPEFFKKSKLTSGIGKSVVAKTEKFTKGSKEFFSNLDDVITGEVDVYE